MSKTGKTLRITAAICAATVIAPATGAAMTDAPAATSSKRSSLDAARKATARFHSVSKAKSDGYGLLKDAAGIACIDKPGEGGMGVHYVNSKLVGTVAVKATTPEALVYERKANGALRLVAIEYVTFQEGWDSAHSGPPRLFGRDFELVPAGNRYGLPAFYELHAWVWKTNPSGTFADWNPRVSC